MLATLHGHFYQPPRENPWTDEIPRQGGARPYHDWNERITDECYRANGWSRILGRDQRIVSIVNNYRHLSFDFGPTLLRDLERRHPRVHARIVEADRASVLEHGGHGNAIAQAYNHMILPLANRRDKETQVRWGLRDFEHRFGRKSEGLWLAETAINAETLEVLVHEGVRFLILAPAQARRVRRLAEGTWRNLDEHHPLDTTRPYRCFVGAAEGANGNRRSIDIFFYDGALAAAVSFQHLLRRAEDLADSIQGAGRQARSGLVHLATDGEVYGHHERFGDMCLAYFAEHEAPKRGIRLVNYGEALDLLPPENEVELNYSENGEGTAWSCVHGVGRWYRDCGCTTYSEPGWSQAWRTPLRHGLDVIRDRIQAAYQKRTGDLLRDPWAARDEYIGLLLDSTVSAREQFLARHAIRPLDTEERRQVFRLLEATHQAMLMYTSCAWFFSDVSGLEGKQNLGYAARAIELAQPFATESLEALLLGYLEQARSNVALWGDGRKVYRAALRHRVTPAAIGARAIFESIFLRHPLERRLWSHEVEGALECTPPEDPSGGLDSTIWEGRLTVSDPRTEEKWEWKARVAPGKDSGRVLNLEAPDGQIERPVRAILRGLPPDLRRETAREIQESLLRESRGWVRQLRSLPERFFPELEAEASPFFRVIEQTVLRWEIHELSAEVASPESPLTPLVWKRVRKLVRRAERCRLRRTLESLSRSLAERVERLLHGAARAGEGDRVLFIEEACSLLLTSRSVGLSLPPTRIEEASYDLLRLPGEDEAVRARLASLTHIDLDAVRSGVEAEHAVRS